MGRRQVRMKGKILIRVWYWHSERVLVVRERRHHRRWLQLLGWGKLGRGRVDVVWICGAGGRHLLRVRRRVIRLSRLRGRNGQGLLVVVCGGRCLARSPVVVGGGACIVHRRHLRSWTIWRLLMARRRGVRVIVARARRRRSIRVVVQLLHARRLHVRMRRRLLLRHLDVGMIRDARSVGWRGQAIARPSQRACECAERVRIGRIVRVCGARAECESGNVSRAPVCE